MFNISLFREPQGEQDSVDVEVLRTEDERFLKRNRIQVDMIDKIFEIVLVAKLPDGRQSQLHKGSMSVSDAFTALVDQCKVLVNTPVMVH